MGQRVKEVGFRRSVDFSCRYTAVSHAARACLPFRRDSRHWEVISFLLSQAWSGCPRSQAGDIARTFLNLPPGHFGRASTAKNRRARSLLLRRRGKNSALLNLLHFKLTKLNSSSRSLQPWVET